MVEVKMTDSMGLLVWYTVGSLEISRDSIAKLFDEIGIDRAYLPREISPRNAFRRAMKKFETTGVPLENGYNVNYLPRLVKGGREKIIYHIVKEVVDPQNVRLSYEPIIEVSYNDRLSVTGMMKLTVEEYNMEAEIAPAVSHCINHYGSEAVRQIFRRITEKCCRVMLRESGGVYFIPEAYGDEVTKMEKFAEKMEDFSVSDWTTRVYSLPVNRETKNVQMVTDHLDKDIGQEAARILDEIDKCAKPSKRARDAMVKKVQDLKDKLTLYEDQLGIIVNAKVDLEAASKKIMRMLLLAT